ncbi:hypothetical protein BC937DRAFT_89510 [Endogone sp. FLAS-F59071]|nr:hypothetical protein BC937DRAFT_89510 [Endogone sp. FLAS-F59071]|eukprot:RUS17767.1 hypothetical protein BC937DRAFT_89510 [Endogone sp. FLAS-F59071]
MDSDEQFWQAVCALVDEEERKRQAVVPAVLSQQERKQNEQNDEPDTSQDQEQFWNDVCTLVDEEVKKYEEERKRQAVISLPAVLSQQQRKQIKPNTSQDQKSRRQAVIGVIGDPRIDAVLASLQKTHVYSSQRFELDDKCWYILDTLPDEIVPNFEELWMMHPKQLGKIKIRGRLISTPRYVQSYGKGYFFSGVHHKGEPIPDIIVPLLSWGRATFRRHFNEVLINWYENGSHYIGRHSDDEPNLVPGSAIVSMSFGETRTFRIRAKGSTFKRDINLKNGSVIVMGGEMQIHYTHEVPKVCTPVGRRVNITLREMKW